MLTPTLWSYLFAAIHYCIKNLVLEVIDKTGRTCGITFETGQWAERVSKGTKETVWVE